MNDSPLSSDPGPCPPPVFTARYPTSVDEVPRGARPFLKVPADGRRVTVAQGWTLRQKPVPDGRGRKTTDCWVPVTSVMLKIRRGQRMVVLVWEDGKYRTGFAHHGGRVTSTQAKAYLTDPAYSDWLEGLAPLPLT